MATEFERLWEQVGDEALREIGRLTLAAIELEDTAAFLCRFVKPRRDEPIGALVAKAIRDAEQLFEVGVSRDRLIAWFTEAIAALADRNAILHSTPVTFTPWPGMVPIPETSGHWLAHRPRDRDRSFVHTRLTAEDLRPIRDRLAAAQEGWVDLITPLEEVRKQAHGAGT